MKRAWKTYLLYGSVIIVVVTLAYILIETVSRKNTGFETKTLWDWMELFIIPLVLSVGAFYLERSERADERQIADRRTKEDQKLAEDRARLEREIAADRQREAALQAYFDRMAELLLKENLRNSKLEEIQNIARTRTLTVLRILDGRRKGLVMRFLHEAKLIDETVKAILDLDGADLQACTLEARSDLLNISLKGVNLQDANLEGVRMFGANLERANLRGAKLTGAKLLDATLKDANLQSACLRAGRLQGANLESANLKGANLRHASLKGANLQGAELDGANLQGTDLSEANLKNAILREANLEGANLESAKLDDLYQLMFTVSLKGATMPDGTTHD